MARKPISSASTTFPALVNENYWMALCVLPTALRIYIANAGRHAFLLKDSKIYIVANTGKKA